MFGTTKIFFSIVVPKNCVTKNCRTGAQNRIFAREADVLPCLKHLKTQKKKNRQRGETPGKHISKIPPESRPTRVDATRVNVPLWWHFENGGKGVF